MKAKLYAFLLLLLFYNRAYSQDCTSLAFTYTTAESRCVATGSITVNVTGGSGNYNYKAIGPVTTPVTSSNIITGLAPGNYSVVVTDLSTNCTKQLDNIAIAGSYNDPRFQLTKTDATCAGNDGTISITNQQFGRSPFTYTILDPSPSNVGASNLTGNFSGLIPGEYVIQLQDSCGGIQVRRITIENYNWWFDSLSVVRSGCDMADVFIRIRDNRGNVNTSGTAFSGFLYGFFENGDTTWFNSNSFSVLLGTRRQLNIVVKDNCGAVHSTVWNFPDNLKPSLGNVSFSDITCLGFTASISGQNLTNPSFCLYNRADSALTCGPVTAFPNLDYDSLYCIKVLDACYDTLIVRCFTFTRPTPSVDTTVLISNRTCSTFNVTITGKANLTNPTYCLLNSSNVVIGCNNDGIFDNVSYGFYCITVHDECTDTTLKVCFTAAMTVASLTGYTIGGTYCNSFDVQLSGSNLLNPQYCLYDSLGVLVTCNTDGSFDSLPYGQYCVRAISCGDTTNSICFTGSRPMPSVGPNVQISNKECTTFSVAITGQTNLRNPSYCLYNEKDSLIACDSSGVFNNVAYGSYCIKIHNNSDCFDTTIIRCFTQLHDVPSVNSTMQILNSNCNTVSFKVNGNNLTSPTYRLSNSSGPLGVNYDGIFNNYPYGEYCVTVEDGCIDTTMTVCQTFTPIRGITLSTSKSCTINTAYVDVQFANNNSPFTIRIYHPNGSLVSTNVTSSNPYRIQLASLPSGTKYKVVGTDNCGNVDSASITPDANLVTKQTTVRGKCPGSIWTNGSGDILARATSNWHSVLPQIIKKNGVAFNQGYASVTGDTYTFVDLEPAQYIVQYTQSSCNGRLYDTVTVLPYAYPTQGQSAVYQCDNNGFSLSADVRNGVSPYSFQIIGSLPETPSIISSAQNNPVFSINNGTTYSLIRLRTIDACGNATLSDVSVLPLQNIFIRVSDSCFYQNITLTVDTIPNASYVWYKKTSPVDSIILDSGLTYNLPFFVPEQVGTYMCKVDVNGGCLTRFSSFSLTGDCYFVLPGSFQLRGKNIEHANQLSWNNNNERRVIKYLVERKQRGENNFVTIGTVFTNSNGNYLFADNNFSAGAAQYRLKVVYVDKTEYSNIIVLNTSLNEITVYPNPVKDAFQISFSSPKPSDFKVELISSNGQLFYTAIIKNISTSTMNYSRGSNIKPGIYLLKVTNKTTGEAEIRKLVFE